ncbi:TPR repeat-containing protein [Stanieria sp. NIES-3757]|nr:TPR repeat-containing protein [Stanieria sp. NIES-3757]
MYGKSLEIYRLGLAMNRLAGDLELEGTALHDLGFSFKNLKQYPEALECYQKALSIAKKISSNLAEEAKVATLNNIGEVYRNLKQYERALKYYRQGLMIALNHQDPDIQPLFQILLNNIEEVQKLSGQLI